MTPEEIDNAVKYLVEDNRVGRYIGLDNYKKPKADYLRKIVSMDNDNLLKECKTSIWLSAYANNNSRSDYHWQCDACYDECQRRGTPEIYSDAYAYNVKGLY